MKWLEVHNSMIRKRCAGTKLPADGIGPMNAKHFILAMTLMLVGLGSPLINASPLTTTSEYHEYILNDMDTGHIDVIIIPSASPWALRDISTIEDALQGWEDGIQSSLSPAWLSSGFSMDIYTLGYDDIPSDALSDPEIVVVAAEVNPFLLFGIGYGVPIGFCSAFNPLDPSIWQQHTGSDWAYASAACKSGGNQCIALNTNFLHMDGPFVTINGGKGERRMYDLVAHEIGHCLGIGHVGDALDFSTTIFPNKDIMSYQYNSNQVFCVSSLNIKSLQGVYADAIPGAPSSATQPRYTGGEFVHLPVGDYSQVSCSNPDNLNDLPPLL